MTQNTWPLPLGNDFADLKADVEAIAENISTNHAGTTRPTGADVLDHMWFVDTDDGVVEMENGAGGWYTLLQLEADGGMVRIDGTSTMTGDFDLDGNDIILDADGDSKIVCDTDDEFSLELGGAEELLVTATIIDCKGNYIQNCAMNANTNTPSGATAYQVELKTSGGVTIYLPAYAAAW